MAESEWPRRRWLVAYSDMWGVTKTLQEAKRCVEMTLERLQKQTGNVRTAISKNAVIVQVGSSTAYHGQIEITSSKHGRPSKYDKPNKYRMRWTRVRPLGEAKKGEKLWFLPNDERSSIAGVDY